MKNEVINITNIIPAQRANSRFKTTVEEFYKNTKMRYNVEISADRKTIKIYGTNYQGNPFENTFKVGDSAEYDSYNLSYYGEIVKITDKGVTIEPRYSSKNKRLDLYTFCSRNFDWNLDETIENNSETMHYI